jgi:hypothetical protein
MAQLFACGLRTREVAELTGYSLARVSVLRATPAFGDLVDQKRGLDEEVLKDGMQAYHQMILENGIKAERKIADKLDDDDETEEMSVRELISISRDSADRVGLSKRSVQTNVSVDFAQLLDRAIARTRTVKEIEVKALEPVLMAEGLTTRSDNLKAEGPVTRARETQKVEVGADAKPNGGILTIDQVPILNKPKFKRRF